MGLLHKEWNDLWEQYSGINIKAPRSHLKTFFFFEMLGLRECLFNDNLEIRYFTGTDRLAIEKLEHIKEFVKLPYFRRLLDGADINNKTELKFGNGSKIYVQGFWSKSRGGHPDIIILDDVIDTQVIYSDEQNKKSKERVASEILPMAEPHTKIVIIGTLQREDDIYAVEWERYDENRRWISKTYDAIVDEEKHITLFPEKWNWEKLMEKRREIIELSGESFFLKEYRNMPVQLIGEIIKSEWKRTYKELPENLKIYTGWDLSVGKSSEKGDWTAKITFGIESGKFPKIYIIDVWRARIDFGKRVKAIISNGYRERPIRIAVEDNVFQADTVQEAKKNSSLPIVGVRTTKNKIEKYNEMLVPLFENGRVYFREGDKMQEEFWRELCSLPSGSHDDMCDAFCVGLKDLIYEEESKFEFDI